MKKISIVWGIIILCIFTLMTILGFKFKKIENYKALEMNMKNYARKYVNDIKDFKYTEPFKINLEDLKKEYQEENFNIKDEECEGYVKVSKYFLGLKYTPYLECTNYKSK